MFCIDASVIISAVLRFENESDRSNAFLETVQRDHSTVFFPEIIIPEVVSGIVRATNDAAFALLFGTSLRHVENFVFVPLDNKLADMSAAIVAKTKLRASDATYVALAAAYRIPLVTLDREQLKRGAMIAETRLP